MIIDSGSLCSKLRPRSIYRSSHKATMAECLRSWNIAVIDLRTENEQRLAPGRRSDYRLDLMQENRGSKSYYDCAREISNINDVSEVVALQYFDIYTQNRKKIADLFQYIATDSRPSVLIFCSAGKDRTGVLVALLMRLLGASTRDIEADYSQAVEQAQVELYESYSKNIDKDSVIFEIYMKLVFPKKETISDFINMVEKSTSCIEDDLWPDKSSSKRNLDLLVNKFC